MFFNEEISTFARNVREVGRNLSFQCLDWIDRNDLDTSETLTVLGLGHQMPSI